MVAVIVVLGRGQLKRLFSRFTLLIVAAVAVIVPWLIIVYNVLTSYVFSQWVYALQMGNPERSLYSLRFPMPIFYLVEMTWPYVDVHPISLLLYIVGLAGLGLFVWRRKQEDKFILVWFICVFVFFTVISNREWRYVLTLFPALAISASALILFAFDRLQGIWMHSLRVNRKKTAKVAAVLLIVFLSVAVGPAGDDDLGATASSTPPRRRGAVDDVPRPGPAAHARPASSRRDRGGGEGAQPGTGRPAGSSPAFPTKACLRTSTRERPAVSVSRSGRRLVGFSGCRHWRNPAEPSEGQARFAEEGHAEGGTISHAGLGGGALGRSTKPAVAPSRPSGSLVLAALAATAALLS